MTPHIIAVGEELPPMERPSPPTSEADRAPLKGKRGTAKAKIRERFAVLNGFVDFALADLTRAEIAVWLVLYRDTRDGTARTSYDDLARRAGCSHRHVSRAVRRLKQRGLLQVVHRGGLRRGMSRYRVCPLPKSS